MSQQLLLSTKAKTLQDLATVITTAKILPIFSRYVHQYERDKDRILQQIVATFSEPLIIRSSCAYEDNLDASHAGAFKSILNVPCEKDRIQEAIEQVIASYGRVSDQDELFIQPMLQQVTTSGVVFTADLDTLSPYYTINYDKSGSTDNITSGAYTPSMQTFIAHKSLQYIEDKRLLEIIRASKECEEIFDNDALDIEFAFSRHGDQEELYILQVRAIVKKAATAGIDDDLDNDLTDSLYKIYKKIDKLNAPHPKLLGDKSIFGVMPDEYHRFCQNINLILLFLFGKSGSIFLSRLLDNIDQIINISFDLSGLVNSSKSYKERFNALITLNFLQN